jgi:hypothetical protein
MLATALGRPFGARAADGDPVMIGEENAGTATTVLRRTTEGTTLRLMHTGNEFEVTGTALEATSWWGDAVRVAVGGNSQTAIRTTSEIGTALRADAEQGFAVHATGSWAVKANGGTYGVYATGGTAVRAEATIPDGYALLTNGRVQFGQASGVAVIAAGSRQVTITPAVKVSTGTKILTTLQSSAGGTTVVHRISRNIPANSFTIYLTGNATQQCYVAWLLIG